MDVREEPFQIDPVTCLLHPISLYLKFLGNFTLIKNWGQFLVLSLPGVRIGE